MKQSRSGKRRRLATWGLVVCLFLVLAIQAQVLAAPVARKHRSTEAAGSGTLALHRNQKPSLGFTPGRYSGYTSQRCTTAAADQGVCKAGQKLPISFTVSSHKLRDLKTVAIDRCSDGLPAIVRVLDYPQAVTLVRSGRGPVDGVLFDDRQYVPDSVPVYIESVAGVVRSQRADGLLSSLIAVSETGQPDPKGTRSCSSGSLHWHARLLGS